MTTIYSKEVSGVLSSIGMGLGELCTMRFEGQEDFFFNMSMSTSQVSDTCTNIIENPVGENYINDYPKVRLTITIEKVED